VSASELEQIQVFWEHDSGWGFRMKPMRFSLAVAVVLAAISASGWAQQDQFKVKSSTPVEKKAAPLPVGKTAGSGTADANAKNLQALEHETAKTYGRSGSVAKKAAPPLKPLRSESNPPISFSSSGSAKGLKSGGVYKEERVRQKSSQQ
jgi:hypothetical protein